MTGNDRKRLNFVEVYVRITVELMIKQERDQMFNPERHELILRILNEKGAISVAELTETLGVSESTVRRDLVELSESGAVNKVHGGATLNKRQFIMTEDSVNDKREKNV